MTTITVRLRIHGRVQGVWYRGWAEDTAVDLGLDGWVRNRAGGSVEVVIHGPERQVEELIRLCHDGPPSARVERVERHEETSPVAPGFRQLPSL